MQEKRSLRHLKRVRETKMARITAAFMIAVIILTMEISYILSGASGKRAFAEEATDEEINYGKLACRSSPMKLALRFMYLIFLRALQNGTRLSTDFSARSLKTGGVDHWKPLKSLSV